MKRIIAIVLSAIIAASLSIGASARLVGDVDSNGKVNSSDALLVLKYAVGSDTSINTKIANVNGDSKVNSADALEILKICVGSYTGDLEVDDGTLKETLIDPIMESGKFTIGTSVTEGGSTIPVTIMVNGSNMAAEMTYSGITMRIVALDGKTYCVLPNCKYMLGQTVYGTLKGDTFEFGEFGTIDGLEFQKSETVTKSGKSYIKESYILQINDYSYTEYNYYFLNGEWKILETVSHTSTLKNSERVWSETTETQTIDTFKSGYDASYFKLTGINIGEIDLSDYE